MNPHDQSRAADASWEMTAGELAAALHDADAGPTEQLPMALAARIVTAGERMVADEARSARTSRDVDAGPREAVPAVHDISAEFAVAHARATNGVRWRWAGWLAAAALLAVWIGVPRPAAVAVMTGAALRDSLLANDVDVAKVPWTTTADVSAVGAGGDVVWSARAQRGVMRLVGLTPNDRTRWQYQLWIFDKRRDQRYPIDGGVFDIPAGAREVLVPIMARLPVGDAVMFAVTVERTGGVVVSTRERIALLAKSGG